jgi:hypothetical protein
MVEESWRSEIGGGVFVEKPRSFPAGRPSRQNLVPAKIYRHAHHACVALAGDITVSSYMHLSTMMFLFSAQRRPTLSKPSLDMIARKETEEEEQL